MSVLSSLLPTQPLRVMDLAKEAGLDVSDWANFKGGARLAAANPKYCYEWAYEQPGELVVLNLWHEEFQESDGVVRFVNNSRLAAALFKQRKAKPQWIKRAESVDAAIRTAVAEGLPIRVVVLAGRRRDRDSADLRSSKVTNRFLDPVPWGVASYDAETGEYILVRGLTTPPVVDQFQVQSPDTPTETYTVTSQVYARNPLVRQQARIRSAGRCEWCNVRGFELPDGSVFLETHHIVPLSEGGPDVVTNVAALCPNHHREAHYGVNREEIREGLLNKIARSRSVS
jgi:5-methylcytosine-specific restriction enzyme A